jgi:hypothetical protein
MQVVIFTSPERGDMLANVVAEFAGYDIAIIGAKETFGIDKFWQRWEQARQICLNSPHDNYLILSDDGSKHDIEAIRTLHKRLGCTQYTCAVISDDRNSCWGSTALSRLDIVVHGQGYIMKHIDFFDCGGLTNRATLEQFEVEPTKKSKRASSGVGMQITQKLRALGVPMYKTSPSLSYHGDHESVMHPQLRKHQPLIANVKQPRIIVGIATFKGREKTLENTVQSLRGQVTDIWVYNNEHPDLTDLADNGKFFKLSQITEPCYFLTCDDDIIYPPTYVEDMIEAIDKHNCIVTHHGRILKKKNVPYYTGHASFHCMKRNLKELYIDVAGTGVTGWHTSYFHPKDMHSAKDLRMSDLVFSLEAKKQGKKIKLLTHQQGYLNAQNIPLSKTIYGMEHKNDQRQTEIANEILKIKV